MFNRIHVLFNDKCLDRVQVRFPRTRKKRIMKKWKSKDSNFICVPSKSLKISHIMVDDSVMAVGHPLIKNHLEFLNTQRTTEDCPLFIFKEES
jgi:hypothetical protein